MRHLVRLLYEETTPMKGPKRQPANACGGNVLLPLRVDH